MRPQKGGAGAKAVGNCDHRDVPGNLGVNIILITCEYTAIGPERIARCPT
jgi:hypothetical protein